MGLRTLPGIVGGTVLRAAAALDARERLQRDDPRDVLAGVESEIFVAGQRRNAAEAARARRKTVTGLSTRCRCLVCGISGRKISSASVCSHQFDLPAQRFLVEPQPGQIRDHQDEDQQRDEARFRRRPCPAISAARRSAGRTVRRSRRPPPRPTPPRSRNRSCPKPLSRVRKPSAECRREVVRG